MLKCAEMRTGRFTSRCNYVENGAQYDQLLLFSKKITAFLSLTCMTLSQCDLLASIAYRFLDLTSWRQVADYCLPRKEEKRKKESCSVTFLVSMVRVWAHREVAGPFAVLADEMVSDRRRRVITGHSYRQMSLAAYDDAAAQLQVGAADRCKV